MVCLKVVWMVACASKVHAWFKDRCARFALKTTTAPPSSSASRGIVTRTARRTQTATVARRASIRSAGQVAWALTIAPMAKSARL